MLELTVLPPTSEMGDQTYRQVAQRCEELAADLQDGSTEADSLLDVARALRVTCSDDDGPAMREPWEFARRLNRAEDDLAGAISTAVMAYASQLIGHAFDDDDDRRHELHEYRAKVMDEWDRFVATLDAAERVLEVK